MLRTSMQGSRSPLAAIVLAIDVERPRTGTSNVEDTISDDVDEQNIDGKIVSTSENVNVGVYLYSRVTT